ncbi:hypothetical protein [Lentibacillus salinarum]|uniref:Uncharacterized protein n=1 Tax=Lentibacillus salinarum TaxID=446820 RepID=A0ABW3ZQN1_9BACI
MENRKTESNDQADELRNLLAEVDSGVEQDRQEEQKQQEADNITGRDVDILNLPPRREVHNQHHQRMTLKLSRATMRMLSVIVILLLLSGTAFYLWGNELWELIVTM